MRLRFEVVRDNVGAGEAGFAEDGGEVAEVEAEAGEEVAFPAVGGGSVGGVVDYVGGEGGVGGEEGLINNRGGGGGGVRGGGEGHILL